MKISVCENRKISCNANQRKELKAFEDARCTKLKKSRIFSWRHNEVWARNYVGVIQVPGLTLEILPKIDKGKHDADEQEKLLAQHNLLYMLSFTRKLPFEERDLAALRLQKMSLLEVLIRIFVNRLLEELRRGVDHAYVNREENLPRVKGKILMNRHLLLNAAHRERFYVGFDEFLDDTPLNRILKATSRRLISVSTDTETQRLLMETTAIFDEVCDIFPDEHHFDRVHLHRNNERFQALLDFCRIVWQEQSPNPSAGDSHTFSILFPMEQLFEEFIARFIRRYAEEFGLKRENIRIQSVGCVEYLLREHESQSRKFKLQPDLLVTDGKATALILDTKWKCLKSDDEDSKNGVPQADMYQMYAYANRYNCNEVILLYPDTGDVTPKSYRLLGDEGKRIRVKVIALSRDLSSQAGRIAFKTDLIRIVNAKEKAP
jgi:5-methylcytosine-specific restriction enzyme subunit McrC